MIRKYTEAEQHLKEWLEINHPDILIELEDLLVNPPAYKRRYDLVDHCDDLYPVIYNYYSEHST